MRHRARYRPFAAAGALALIAACATNPATGKRQIMLVGEAQEIAMGQEADQEVASSLGLYPDDALQAYVAGLGKTLAASGERPSLPWTFRVVDDPAVNAFALPGGFIYVTRGIMTHLNSEAELASVVGHEISSGRSSRASGIWPRPACSSCSSSSAATTSSRPTTSACAT